MADKFTIIATSTDLQDQLVNAARLLMYAAGEIDRLESRVSELESEAGSMQREISELEERY